MALMNLTINGETQASSAETLGALVEGLGMKPDPVFLKPGDVMNLGIQGLGEQRQDVVAYPG